MLTKVVGFLVLATLVVSLASVQQPAAAASGVSDAQIACGTVDLGTAARADVASAFSCFARAYAHCDFASLVATSSASDAKTSTFVIYPGDRGCNISETVTGTSGTDGTLDSYVCSSVSQDGSALHFVGCGAQRDVWLRPANG